MTIADDFLQGVSVSGPDSERLRVAANWTARRLRLPFEVSVIEAQSLAERYLFEESPRAAVDELQRIGNLDYGLVIEAAGLVNDPMWIEMPVHYTDSNRKIRMGYMIASQGERTFVVIVAKDRELYDGIPVLVGYVSIPGKFPMDCDHEKIPIDVHGWVVGDPQSDEIGTYLFDVVDALFLLCTPRTTKIDHVQHDRRLQETRVRQGKPGLLDYRRVRMVLGKSGGGGGGGIGGGGGKKAAHRVGGHVRVYRKVYGKDEMRERPLVKFIPEHWRGDARLGVVLHERSVVRR